MGQIARSRSWRVASAGLVLAACSGEPPVVGAALGGSFLNAVRLGVEDAGPAGSLTFDTLLLPESTNRSLPAIQAADALVRRAGLVAVVGHSNSGASLAAAPIYHDAQVVQIAPTSTAPALSRAGPYTFRLVPNDDRQGAFLARVLDASWPGGARLAVFYVNDDYGRGLRRSLLASVDSNRHQVVFDTPHSDEEVVDPPPDRRARVAGVVRTAVQARPEVVLWLGRPATFQMYLAEIRRQLPGVRILGGDAMGTWNRQDTTTGHWRAIRFVDFLVLDGTDELRRFRERYAARFGIAAGASEVLSYDAIRLVAGAIADGARSGDDVRDWLLSLGRSRPAWEGLSGPISFAASGEVERSYVLTTIP